MVPRLVPTRDGPRTKWACVEEWVFAFGFVIPGSTNSWQSVISSARNDEGRAASSARDLEGIEFLIETTFYDEKSFICKESAKACYV